MDCKCGCHKSALGGIATGCLECLSNHTFLQMLRPAPTSGVGGFQLNWDGSRVAGVTREIDLQENWIDTKTVFAPIQPLPTELVGSPVPEMPVDIELGAMRREAQATAFTNLAEAYERGELTTDEYATRLDQLNGFATLAEAFQRHELTAEEYAERIQRLLSDSGSPASPTASPT